MTVEQRLKGHEEVPWLHSYLREYNRTKTGAISTFANDDERNLNYSKGKRALLLQILRE